MPPRILVARLLALARLLAAKSFDHQTEEIPIPEAAGVAGVQVRFHYPNSRFGHWWQLDNVLVGSEVTCDPIEGGLVAGHVRDRNTGSGVAGRRRGAVAGHRPVLDADDRVDLGVVQAGLGLIGLNNS